MCGNGGSKGYTQIEIVIVGLFFPLGCFMFPVVSCAQGIPFAGGKSFLMHAMFMPCLLSCCRSVFRDFPTATLT